MVKLPREIRVGSIVYALRLDGHPDHPLGKHDLIRQRITIHRDSEPGVKVQTLWHEIIHAVTVHFLGTLESEDHDEKKISLLGNALMTVLTDNPDLLKLMSEYSESLRRRKP